MAQRLIELAASHGTFFVLAGAGYFAGPDRVIKLLKKDESTLNE